MRFSQLPIVSYTVAILTTIACIPNIVSAQSQSATSNAPIPGAPKGVTAFVGVSIVPMDSERVFSNQTVLIEGGRIAALGPANTIHIPSGATKVNAQGEYLIPGLADMHVHLHYMTHMGNVPKLLGTGWTPMPMESLVTDSAMTGTPEDRLFLWLANGATTVRVVDFNEDLTKDPKLDRNETWGKQALQLRAKAAAGEAWFPTIHTAGQWGPRRYIGMLKASPQFIGDTSQPLAMDSIATYIAAYKAKGYDFIKLHEESLEIIDSVMAAAKRVGIPVIGHVPNGTVEHALTGYKSIEHPVTDYAWNQAAGLGALAAAMRRADVYDCVTQAHYDILHYSVWSPEKILNLKVLQDSGVKLLIGTDEMPRNGLITRELQEFVAMGLTPYQALQAATVNVARYFGTSNESGTIAVGKRADMVLLTGNPLQDVRYTAQPAGVMIGGRWLSREEIDRRIKGMKLITFTPGEGVDVLPLKSYWRTVVDEMVGTAVPVFGFKFIWSGVQEIGNRYTDSTIPPAMKKFREEMINDYGDGYQNTAVSPVSQKLRTSFKAQRDALIDSLGTSNQYAAGTQRVVRLMAQELGEFRAALPETQRATFDTRARPWLQQRQAQGYTVSIPGV